MSFMCAGLPPGARRGTMATLQNCSEILSRLRAFNADEKRAFRLMTSDDIYRKHMADLVRSSEQLDNLLQALSDAHYVFRLKVVEPDEQRRVPGVYAYLAAELPLIGKLRGWADKYLEAAYEQQFYRRKQAMPILRELIPESRKYNSTELGRGLNIASMLLQYEKLIVEAFGEFTDGWRWRRLKSALLESALISDDEIEAYEARFGPEPQKRFGQSEGVATNAESETQAAASDASEPEVGGLLDGSVPSGHAAELFDSENDPPGGGRAMDAPVVPGAAHGSAGTSGGAPRRRAVDEAELVQIQAMNLSGGWGVAVERYGVQFLIRIHLRKYEFDTLRSLIRGGRIAREEDLRFLRDSLRKMQGRLDADPTLKLFLKAMAEVRRLAPVRLNRIYEVKRRLTPDQIYAVRKD